MQQQYRFIVWRDDRLWCRIDVDSHWASEVAQDITVRFPTAEGYRIERFVATQERRIVESGPDGMRLLVREPLYQICQATP